MDASSPLPVQQAENNPHIGISQRVRGISPHSLLLDFSVLGFGDCWQSSFYFHSNERVKGWEF
jgi:hypothetical protein